MDEWMTNIHGNSFLLLLLSIKDWSCEKGRCSSQIYREATPRLGFLQKRNFYPILRKGVLKVTRKQNGRLESEEYPSFLNKICPPRLQNVIEDAKMELANTVRFYENTMHGSSMKGQTTLSFPSLISENVTQNKLPKGHRLRKGESVEHRCQKQLLQFHIVLPATSLLLPSVSIICNLVHLANSYPLSNSAELTTQIRFL